MADEEQAAGVSWWRVGLQILAVMFIMTMMTRKTPEAPIDVVPDEIVSREAVHMESAKKGDVAQSKQKRPPIQPFFSPGEAFDMRVYIAEGGDASDLNLHGSFTPLPADNSPYPMLVWEEKGITLSDVESNYRETTLELHPSQAMYNNGSIFAHVIFAPSKKQNPNPAAVMHSSYQLNRYRQQRRYVATKNLLSGEVKGPSDHEDVLEAHEEPAIISYWNPNVTLQIVDDFANYASPAQIPDPIRKNLRIHPNGRYYYPLIFWNDFWVLSEHFYPLNDTLETLPLHITYSPLAMWKYVFTSQMGESFSMQTSFGSSDTEMDEVKRMLMDTNPILLGVTIAVSILHMVFDFLAFTNDVSFWKNKKNMVGMSVRTLFVSTVSQLIIFLYLLDNDTSFMVLISAGIQLVIDCWKISKAVNVILVRDGPIPYPWFDYKETYTESSTSEYDRLAFRYLSWVLFPLLGGYAVYSLLYDTHKSWYSWILSSLTGAVYTFGFIMMTPQLFINYKLKSVAHLNGRVFMYKALNTFIDDLFAFVIKMPTMHRLACLRDDFVFFIYLYQRWIYPVDKTRVNEFGVSGEDGEVVASSEEDEKRKEKAQDGADKVKAD